MTTGGGKADTVAGVERALSVAAAGVAAAAARLSGASLTGTHPQPDGDPDDPPSAADVEAAADMAIEEAGGDPAGNTHVVARGAIRSGDPIVVAAAPRVDGNPGPLSRTLVVDGGGGWNRRAAVAVEMAHDAVRRAVEPGVPARRVVDEAVAELGAYGLATASEGPPVARPVRGPTVDFETDASLAAGTVFALDPAATPADPGEDRGSVRVGSCYVVTEEGCRPLESTPTSLSPAAYP